MRATDALTILRDRRDGGEARPSVGRSLDLSCRTLIGADLRGLDLSGADLRGADLSRADLRGASLVGARLDGAVLHETRLEHAELLGASLVGADLTEVRAERAGFGGADLSRCRALSAHLDGATLTGARIEEADLRAASLRGARLRELTLRGVVLHRADLRDADLGNCRVAGASFRDADLREAHLRGIHDYADADWIGVDIRHTDFCGAWLLRRHILDENYLYEFRTRSRGHAITWAIWWATSDCGRSVTRWTAWTLLLSLVYAGLYRLVDLQGVQHPLDTLYFSVVTFTTLGYGDLLPVSPAAKLLTMSEVLFGYVALGGVLSILANKMARRAG